MKNIFDFVLSCFLEIEEDNDDTNSYLNEENLDKLSNDSPQKRGDDSSSNSKRIEDLIKVGLNERRGVSLPEFVLKLDDLSDIINRYNNEDNYSNISKSTTYPDSPTIPDSPTSPTIREGDITPTNNTTPKASTQFKITGSYF